MLTRERHGTYFANSPTGHIPSNLEGKLCLFPGIALVGRPQDGAVIGIPVVGVHANCNIHPIGIDGVGRDRINAPVVPGQ